MHKKVNLKTLIDIHYTNFTKAEQKVADFVLKEPNQILYTSITDFAELCGVGDTSVFRLCKKLGFNGYQEFKMFVAQNSQGDNDGSKELDGSVLSGDPLEAVCKKVLDLNISALNETFSMLEQETLGRAVQMLLDAQRIHFFGIGSSGNTALEARGKFMRITAKVDCQSDIHYQTMAASLMTPQDVGIIFSFSGSTKDMIEIAKLVKASGAQLICVTRYPKSPVAQHADLVLLSGAMEGPLQGGSLSAKMAQLYLLDILYYEFFRRTDAISRENKEKTAKAVSGKLV